MPKKEKVSKKDAVKEQEKQNTDSSLMDIVEITRLTPANTEFYLTKGGFIGIRLDGEDKGRAGLFRMTPITNPDQHISVRDMELKEFGIVFDIKEFPEGQKTLMREELSMRYFTPIVRKITHIKEEYGYTFITAETDVGTRDFTLRDLSNSILFLTAVKCLLIDTDGNRYIVENVKELGDKTKRIIGVWA